MSEPTADNVKTEAIRLIDSLPERAGWDDVMYGIYVRQCIESGIADADAKRITPVDEVRRRFGLSS